MAVTMICPNLKCGRTVMAADSARGKVVRCAHCRTLFLVPRDARTAAAHEPKPPEASTKEPKRPAAR